MSEILDQRENLLDGKGFVQLLDVSPRLSPEGRTAEFVIAESARVSYGSGIKSQEEDLALIRYLYRHQHGSPFEMVQFRFKIKAPIFIARQIFRHRTGKFNEISRRYVELDDEQDFYNPLEFEEGIRGPSLLNKQGSEKIETNLAITAALGKSQDLLKQVYANYKELCDLGLACEVARTVLPVSQYTYFIFSIDLRNLLSFIRQREDSHAQKEIQVYAEAIRELITPWVPQTVACMLEERESLTLSPLEIAIFRQEKELSEVKSKSQRKEIADKLAKLIRPD